jgi:hypothetical protein
MESLLLWLVIVGLGAIVIALLLLAVSRAQLRTPNTLPRVCLGCAHLERRTEFGQHLFACHKRFFFPGMYTDCRHKVSQAA